MRRASDLFGTPSGSLRTDKLISASVQWARKKMMEKTEIAYRTTLSGVVNVPLSLAAHALPSQAIQLVVKIHNAQVA
jgi:hypothetical protein